MACGQHDHWGESGDSQELPEYIMKGKWWQEIKIKRDRIRKTSCHMVIFEHDPVGSGELMNSLM